MSTSGTFRSSLPRLLTGTVLYHLVVELGRYTIPVLEKAILFLVSHKFRIMGQQIRNSSVFTLLRLDDLESLQHDDDSKRQVMRRSRSTNTIRTTSSMSLSSLEELEDKSDSESLQHDDDSKCQATLRTTSSMMSLSSLDEELEDEESPPPRYPARKQVSFSKVEIQEYAIQLGDNPATAGVPITIGWEPQLKIVCDIDEYESLRPIMTRRGANLAFPSELRVAMLLKQGTCMRDILHVKRESQKIRRARMKSIQSIKWDGVNEALESASRTAKKLAAKPFLMLPKKKTINRDAPC
jgi:hypothetical protein